MKLHLSLLAALMISKGALGGQLGIELPSHHDGTSLHVAKARDTYTAAMEGNLSVFQFLIHKRAYVNMEDFFGRTPLFVAAFYGYLEVVKALCDTDGIDVNKANNYGHTPLFAAARYGKVDIVMALFSSDKIKIDENLQEKIVNFLKEANANINTVMENGETLLYVASKKGYMRMVETLWQEGADMNLGKSPLVGAIKNGHTNITDFLLEKGISKTPAILDIMGPGNIVDSLRKRELGKRKR
jgi:ankyrin repeat protein